MERAFRFHGFLLIAMQVWKHDLFNQSAKGSGGVAKVSVKATGRADSLGPEVMRCAAENAAAFHRREVTAQQRPLQCLRG